MGFERFPKITTTCLVASLLLAGVGRVQASTHQARQARHMGASAMANPPVRTWHVIAGYGQMLPAMNDSREEVDQFYPRELTIYAGDSVTWTVNSKAEIHTVTFGPDSILRKLEDPQNQMLPKMINGKQALLLNPAVFAPSAAGPLVERDMGSATTLLNCGVLNPAGVPGPHACTVTFPNVGTYAYDCLIHSGIPGYGDMDGVIKVIARPQAVNHTWTVWAGTGKPTDAVDGFFPDNLTIHAGDRVTWKSGGVFFHTVSFGIDPRTAPLIVQVGTNAHGPFFGLNPRVFAPVIPKEDVYTGGVASSGIVGLGGNFMSRGAHPFNSATFSLTFTRPGTYTYYCLVHAPLMKGTITVLPAGQ